MFESKSELLDKIRLGEDSRLGLQELRFAQGMMIAPNRDNLAQRLCGFANSYGGVSLLGVGNRAREAQMLSQEQLDRTEACVRDICLDAIDPPLSVHIEKLALPRADGNIGAALRVDVTRSLWIHGVSGSYFQRIGSSTRPMAPDYLARLFQQRSQTRIIGFDQQIVPTATAHDLEEQLWTRFCTGRTQGTDEDFLFKLGLIRTDDDSANCPTVAGILMATDDPTAWFPNAYIQAVAYSGTTVVPSASSADYQLDARDIKGPLDQQIVEACKFVVKNMSVAAAKKVGRQDSPDYDITSIFEALVNAVAHRNYAIHGSKIRLRIFSDRLELYSPGTIPNTMTVESLPYRQSARNETITSLLAKCSVPQSVDWLETNRATMMDRRGEGVSIILENSEGLSGKKPVYNLIDEAELLLTVYSANYQDATQ